MKKLIVFITQFNGDIGNIYSTAPIEVHISSFKEGDTGVGEEDEDYNYTLGAKVVTEEKIMQMINEEKENSNN
jgi:hypothetical protein